MREIAKKVIVWMLMLILLLSLGSTAFAEEYQYTDSVTITINNAYTEGEEPYRLYRMLEIDTLDLQYKISMAWVDFFTTGYGAQFVTVENDYDKIRYVTEIREIQDVEKFASEAYAYVLSKELPGDETTKDDVPTEDHTIVHKASVPGYYLIVSPKGKICSIVYAGKSAEINEKNVYEPSVEFYILDNGVPKKYADMQAGAIVDYVVKLNLVEGIRGFRVVTSHAVECPLIPESVQVEGMTTQDYDFYSSGNGIDYILRQEFLDSIKGEKTVTIKYRTRLSNIASFNTLSTYRDQYIEYWYNVDEFTNNNKIVDCAKIYSWDFTINDYVKKIAKYAAGEEEVELPLANVHYILSRTNDADNPDPIDFVRVSDGVYRIATAADYDGGNLPFLVTDLYKGEQGWNNLTIGEDNRLITLQGLDGGTYYLIQTNVPYGYSRNAEPIEIKIAPAEDPNGLSLAVDRIEFVHTTNPITLPSTGGPGTVLLITVSAALFILALTVAVTKLRILNQAKAKR